MGNAPLKPKGGQTFFSVPPSLFTWEREFSRVHAVLEKMKVLGIYLTYMAKAMGWFWWLVAYFWCKCRHVSLVYEVWSQKECSVFISSHAWRSRSNLLSHKEVFCLLTLNLSLARIKLLLTKICSNFMNDSKFQLNSTVFLNTSRKYIFNIKTQSTRTDSTRCFQQHTKTYIASF